jgi:malate dehydrogenase (oxaloacetate-decarboxylating)(NADP+)
LGAAGKTLRNAQFVVTGAGPASIASAELLCALGVDNAQILVVDHDGVIHADRRRLEEPARSFALKTSRRTLQDAVKGADVFIGLSRTGALTSGMLRQMAPHPVVVALADAPWGAWWPFAVQTRADALHVSADHHGLHQATDLLALPGLMRGTMDVNAVFVDDTMRAAAVRALAACAPGVRAQQRRRADDQRGPSLLPSLVDPCLVPAVASAVAGAALVVGAAPRRAAFDSEAYAATLRRSTSVGGAGL